MNEIKARHILDLDSKGNPKRKEFSQRVWERLPSKTINNTVYQKMGYVLETIENSNRFIPEESLSKFIPEKSLPKFIPEESLHLPLSELTIIKLKKYIKDNNLDVNERQPKDSILEDLKALGHE